MPARRPGPPSPGAAAADTHPRWLSGLLRTLCGPRHRKLALTRADTVDLHVTIERPFVDNESPSPDSLFRPASSSGSAQLPNSPPQAGGAPTSGRGSGRHRRRAILDVMSVEPGKGLEPPMLPAALLEVWPVIAVGALAWLVAAVAAFVVPSLETWGALPEHGRAERGLSTNI